MSITILRLKKECVYFQLKLNRKTEKKFFYFITLFLHIKDNKKHQQLCF